MQTPGHNFDLGSPRAGLLCPGAAVRLVLTQLTRGRAESVFLRARSHASTGCQPDQSVLVSALKKYPCSESFALPNANFCTFLVLAAILVTDIRSVLVRTYTHCLHYRHRSTIYCIIRTRQGDAYRRQCTMCPFPHPHTRHAPELRAAQTRQLPASYCSTPCPCMHILFIARFYGACGPLMP